MCCRFGLLLLILICGSASIFAQVKPEVIDLGGPRKVQATITVSEKDYTVEVSIKPLKVFDEATNDEINRDLAREYALRALARHLSKDGDVRFDVSGERTVESGLKADRYCMLIRWPKDRVRVRSIDDEVRPEKGTIVLGKSAFQSKLFTAAQDHVNTLNALRDHHNRAIASGAKGEQGKAFRKAIAVVEERGTQSYDAVAKTIREDENLIDITERPELLAVVRIEQKRFLQSLRDAIATSELPPLSAHLTDVEIGKPFDIYLRKNPLLMDYAGAILIELSPERWVVIGIAKTILKDDSPQEILRAEKVCTLKAKAAIIAERDGTQVTYLKQVKDTIVIVKDEIDETSKSISERTKITQETASAIIKGMPVVGRWRSGNGKLFYLAIGSIVDGKGEVIRE